MPTPTDPDVPVALRAALEDLKEAAGLATQALRDAALGARYQRTQALGAIEAAQHRLERARANLAAAWVVASDPTPEV